MTVIDWIFGAEALGATAAAIVAIRSAVRHREASLDWQAKWAVADVLYRDLRDRREANLLPIRPRRGRFDLRAFEDPPKPG